MYDLRAGVLTTAAAFDTSHASVLNQRPASGAGSVPAATGIVLFVNKALDASTVPAALHVTANGQLVAGAVTVVDGGRTIEFAPSSALPYGALVQVFLDTTALDTGGNTVSSYTGQFTVVGDPAATAPAVLNVSPMNNAVNVPTNAVIHLQYSGTLNAAGLNSTNVFLQGNGSNNVAAALTLDASGTLIQLQPTAALAATTRYCYYAQNLQGTNGITVANAGFCFTTGAAAQTAAPTVTAVSPADGLANVPVNANIRVQFSAPIDPTTVNASTIQVTGGNQTVMASSIAFSNNNQTVLLTPLAPLPAATALTAGVTDLAGNTVATHTTHFTTASIPQAGGPVVMAVNPPPNATNVPVNVVLSLQTNVALDPTTVGSASYQLYDNTLSQYVAATYSQSSDGLTTFLLPDAPLATGRTYSETFYGSGITDLIGNPLSLCCGITNYSFTTGVGANTAPPQVLSASPGQGISGIPLNARIMVLFNAPINEESLGQVTLTTGGTPVAFTVSLSNANQTLTIAPSAALSQNTTYTFKISGVSDLAGNQMAAAYTSSFKTASAPDFSMPSVISVTPADKSAGIATASTIQVQFSKFISSPTVSLSTFTVSSSGGVSVVGTITLATDGSSAVFSPTSALTASTTYFISVTAGVLDLEGQPLVAFQSTFTTGTQ